MGLGAQIASVTVASVGEICYSKEHEVFGMWRSLVARTLGVREVVGSNPAIPTNHITFDKISASG